MVKLLEVLANIADGMYISDLHQKQVQINLKHTLPQIDPQDYTVEEWKEAVAYIVKEPTSFSSQEQAFETLMQFLK